jgi:Xaa-Pro aminopeptidase
LATTDNRQRTNTTLTSSPAPLILGGAVNEAKLTWSTPLSQRRSLAPPSGLAARLEACRARIHEKSVSGYLITNRADQFYLTGFDGEDGAALILPDRVCLLTDGRFREEAQSAAPWAQAVVRLGTPLVESLAKVVRRHRLKRLGFQPGSLSVASYRTFHKALRPTSLIAVPNVLSELRLAKDASEVAAIGRAIQVAEAAFKAVTRRIRPGWTESLLAAELEYDMLCRGASGPSFPTIVAVGANASVPHYRPGEARVEVGSAILIDWGATVDHYRSDLTRVVFIRRIPPRFRRMYADVLAAQEEGIRAVRPGARACDVDGAARRSLKKVGMDKYFAHGLGHGLGLDIHEPPRVAMKMEEPLQSGMVVTVEPGVYLPGVGGVRIEDDVLVTQDGCRVLTHLPKDIESMVI